jgi:hypothetical protein
MRHPSACPDCRSSNLFRSVKPVSSGGGYAPDILQGLSPWHRSARVRIVVCGACGLIRSYAEPEAVRALPSSSKWERI